MKSTALFLLGRRLMQLAEEGLPGEGLHRGVRLVLLDVAANPGSSISEIRDRTGYPQSHVSTSVIKLRDLGAVRTEADPDDRRRTLVWIVPAQVRRAHDRLISTADAAIARALGNPSARELTEVLGALEMLADRLDPPVASPAVEEAS